MNTWQEHPWMGVFAATLCPFHKDESLDEAGLRAYIHELTTVPGLKGVVPNGHTGEIMSLREAERAEVTRIVAEEVSGVRCQEDKRKTLPEREHLNPDLSAVALAKAEP